MKSTAKPSSRWRSLDLLQDLALHDDVERGRRLVHDHELGLERERHRDDHALAHPARELVRVGADAARGRCRRGRAARRRAASASRFEMCSCARIMSTNWSPTRITGLSAFIALWKTIETLRQRKRAQLLRALRRRGPRRGRGCCRRRCCAGGRRICMTAFATVLLPQPDSPARPRISPARDRRGRRRRRAHARRRRRRRARAARRASRASSELGAGSARRSARPPARRPSSCFAVASSSGAAGC